MNEKGSTGIIILAVIIGIIIGILGTIAFVRLSYYQKFAPILGPIMEKIEKRGDLLNTIENAKAKDDEKVCDTLSVEEEKVYCKDSFYINKAEISKSLAFCTDKVSENRKDSCYNIIAIKTNDETACYKINTNLKQDCLNTVLKYKSVDKNDINLCLQTTGEAQEYCISKISSKQVKREFCDQIPETYKQTCLDKVILNEALALQKVELCDEIKNKADSVSCKQGYYTPADSDSDQLNDLAEIYYGTDSNKADSDSDSYLDGEEVINGYNPLGAGRMGEAVK